MTAPHAAAARLGPIELAPGVSRGHVLSFLFAALITIGLFTYLTALTPYILEVNLGMSEDRQGRFSGTLQFSQELIILACIGWWGAMSDRFGRRSIFIAGFAILAIAFAVYPFARTENELVMYRLIYGFGLAAASAMLATVLADYPAENSRGKLIGLSFFLNGIGSVFFFVVLTQLPSTFSAQGISELWSGRLSYLSVALIALLGAIVMFGLKPGRPTRTEEKIPILTLIGQGITAGRNPRISLAYGSAFAARADMAMVTLFLTLWVVQAALAAGASAGEAAARGGMAIGISQFAAVLWAPVMGIIGDRYNRVTVMVVGFGIAALGYSWIAFIDDILAWTAIPALIVLGMGLSSAILASTLLLGQEAPADLRGSVFGLQAFCGALGILSISLGGGWLYDNVGSWGPFAAMATANSLIFIAAILVRKLSPGPLGQAVSDRSGTASVASADS